MKSKPYNSFLQIFFFFRKSAFIRSLLVEESDENLLFLEEQQLMKINKTNDELIKMFEANIAKEYGQIIKKWRNKMYFLFIISWKIIIVNFYVF